ncbi:MAG: hypothetical protein AAF402_12505 [Pseudomonadota bacterium]
MISIIESLPRFLAKSALIPVLAITGAMQTAVAQDYTQVTRLGTNEAVCKAGIETREDLQAFFRDDSFTVGQILQDANWPGDQRDLEAAVAAGNFVEKNYEPGSRFDWMGARKKNAGVALPKREWAGADAFAGYEVEVTSQCQVYTMVIPKICCNLALFATEPAPVPQPVMNVSSDGNIVTACTEPGNQLMVAGADGSSRSVSPGANGCWSGILPAGDYEFKATNPMCSGADTLASYQVAQLEAAPAPEQPAPPIVQAPKPKTLIPFAGAFLGSETRMRFEPAWDMDMKDSSGVFGFKGGLMKFVNPKTAVFGQLGYVNRRGINEGNVYPDDNLFFDIGVDRTVGEKGFVGVGVGLWNFDDSDFNDESIFIHGGRYIGKSNAQWYVEGRVFADDTDDISNNNMYSAGIRYLFK